jgi:acetyl-CoA acetyltransferase
MAPRTRAAGSPDRNEFGAMPYGQTVAAQHGYGHMYTRHMHEFGSTPEQFAKLAVDQRFNTLNNPRSHFARFGEQTIDDVLNSRYTNYPLHLLESVMPVAGAISFVLTTAERAKSSPHPAVYILGIGLKEYAGASNMQTRWTEPGVKYSAKIAFEMSGYRPSDVDFANVYD